MPSRSLAILVPMTAAASSSAPNGGQDARPITVASEGMAVVISVESCLDQHSGKALLDAVSAAMATSPTRLDIDLRALDDFTSEGAEALASCRALGAGLPEGLHYRTGRGPGRDALLSAYTTAEMPAIGD